MTKIYVDMDQTLVRLLDYVCDEINRIFGNAIPVDTTAITYYSWLQDQYGKELVEGIWSKPGIYDNYIKPFDGAVDFIRELIKMYGRYNVTIITATPDGMEEEKKRYCKNHFGISNVICDHVKHIHTGDGIIIDDYWVHCDLHIINNDKPAVLLNYNEEHAWATYGLPYITRKDKAIYATSYNEVLKELERIRC